MDVAPKSDRLHRRGCSACARPPGAEQGVRGRQPVLAAWLEDVAPVQAPELVLHGPARDVCRRDVVIARSDPIDPNRAADGRHRNSGAAGRNGSRTMCLVRYRREQPGSRKATPDRPGNARAVAPHRRYSHRGRPPRKGKNRFSSDGYWKGSCSFDLAAWPRFGMPVNYTITITIAAHAFLQCSRPASR